jgi:hypothetical protein
VFSCFPKSLHYFTTHASNPTRMSTPTQLSLDKAIVMVLGRNRGITKEEIFNYIKYQSLMGDTQPTQHDVNQECDKLIRSSKIEKNDEQQIHLFSY